MSEHVSWLNVLFWAASFIVLAAWWFALRRIPVSSDAPLAPDWQKRPLLFRREPLDNLSLALVACMTLCLWFARHDLFPVPPDGYYHIRVAQRIYETGSIPLWNDWEFAPEGRPHLYPPFYHILLASLASLHHGDMLASFRDVQVFIIPFAHLCVWWLARWLFDSRRAFLTILLVGADPLLAIVGATAPPSILAGAFATLMLLFFLSGHTVAAACVAAVAFYCHMGILPLALLGLALWCLWQRTHGKRLLAFTLFTAVLIAPWALWTLQNHDWFKHPIELGIYRRFSPIAQFFIKIVWLQFLNLALCLIVFRALRGRNWKDPRNRLLVACAAGFLPMLFSYGGRYFAHTVHFWAILGAALFIPILANVGTRGGTTDTAGSGLLRTHARARLLPKPLSPTHSPNALERHRTIRRIAAFVALALCPTAVLVGYGTVVPPGPIPMLSAWCLPPFAAAGGLKALKNGETLGLFPFDDTRQAGEFIKANTPPDVIVHCPAMNRDFALLVGFFAGRAIDKGAWEETMPDGETMRAIYRYQTTDPRGVYITNLRHLIPRDCETRRFGSLYVGLRHAEKSHPQLGLDRDSSKPASSLDPSEKP